MSVPFQRAAVVGAIRLALVVTLFCGTDAKAEIKSRSELAAILARSPAPEMVGQGCELDEAEKMAAGIKGATAYLGVGRSMEPLYATNTAVIAVPIKYDQIRKGMTLVYVCRDGWPVAHVVVGETRGGYLVQGIDNAEADADVVNETNLVGVVVRAFSSTETGFRQEVALQLAVKERPAAKKPRV